MHCRIAVSTTTELTFFSVSSVLCRIPSKFDLRRFCRATGAMALVAVQAPTADELGFAKELTVEEV